jgi:hypothetical protein
VRDAKGLLVRRLTSKEPPEEKPVNDEGGYSDEKPKPTVLSADPGLHRVVWDFKHDGARLIPGAKLDGGHPEVGPRALPGDYTIELTVEDTVAVPVKVLPDPRVKTDPPTEEQLALALECRDAISRLSGIVEEIRSVRRQIQEHAKLLTGNARAEPLRKAAEAVLPRLDALEEKLHNPRAKVSYDILAQKGGAKLYSQLAWLLEQIKESDATPGQGWREAYQEQVKLLKQYEGEWRQLRGGEVASVNDQARRLELPLIVVPGK